MGVCLVFFIVEVMFLFFVKNWRCYFGKMGVLE